VEFEFNTAIHSSGVMEKIRSCPICPVCGSKKFDRLKAKDTIVKCTKCGKELTL
jgi:ribosomal protein L37AE/L43A